jgi:adenine-specific DNA-methyltransferase
VSGENDFFLADWTTVVERNLQTEFQPIISRSEQVRGIILSDSELDDLRRDGKRVSIFMPDNLPIEDLSVSAQDYIRWGEQKGFNKNYKCRIRKRWYIIPTTWTADAFLIRQANLYPKMILNSAGALVTDTLHKVRFLDGVDGRLVTAAFINAYTLALSETLGRSYGGGVLTFEPGEMRKIRIPMIGAEKLDIMRIDQLQRDGEYEKILFYTDQVLLYEGLGLSEHEVNLLHSIWKKMRDRRLSRKQVV